MEVRQGELNWVDFGEPGGSRPGYLHPCVVVQRDAVNISAIRTTIVCALTTDLHLGRAPGNVLLSAGEGGLKKDSVVNVSQLMTVDKEDLCERIGRLPVERRIEIFNGIRALLEVFG